MILEVEGGGYDTAASALVGANHVGAINYNTLTGKLGGFAAMAGDDATSEEFAREYDVAAKEAVDGMNDLVDAFATVGVLTATSIENHRNANAGSVYARPATVYTGGGSLPRGGPVDVPVYSPPSSLGGDNEDLPDFWNEIVDHLEGFAWPNANTGKLRSAAAAWRSAATDVDQLAGYCDTAEAQLSGQTSPEIPLALDAFKDLQQSIRDLAASCRDIGQACDDYATEVETHRDIIKDIIRDMAIEAGIGLAAGAVVGFFTFGGGAAVGGAIAATRIASAARKILAALRALKAAARLRAVAKLTSVISKVKPLRAVLAKFKNAKKVDDAADVAVDAAKAERRRRAADNLTNPQAFDPQDLQGMSRSELDDLLKDWPSRPSNSGDGVVYTDPANKGRQIRLMPGYLEGTRPDLLTHGPYAQVSQNGIKTKIPLEGNPTL